ncbi:MAG: AAA family ATPase [Gammaproteobacteria bacterium]|nr:AAA family ATPase [Gammaproteobacteria bacterium]
MSSQIYNNKLVNDLPRIDLSSPTSLPNASSFLWNKNMVLQANCRGYVTSQFMQPEPAKYSHAPLLEEKTFIQPEQPFYTEHPGRFVFIKNEDTGEIFSAPYEPMKSNFDYYCFSAGIADIQWRVSCFGIELTMTLSLTQRHNVELWRVDIVNKSDDEVNLSVYPYFTIGYMSWMNQSAQYDESLYAIIASSVTPYQKVEQYFKNQELKDKSCLIASTNPTSWTTSFSDFVGIGGLTRPDSLLQPTLNNLNSHYETPVAVMQYSMTLAPKENKRLQFAFGPAKDEAEIKQLALLLTTTEFNSEIDSYHEYINSGVGCLKVNSPDEEFNQFINHWLPRQMFYHGDVNRLSTDPQTRNYVQDAMSMIYIQPDVTRARIVFALKQQKSSGQMPDGILLSEQAELKYINQVPHADHCVWLPICLLAYLEETNDAQILFETTAFADSSVSVSVAEHIELAIEWLLSSTDERGLSLIEQGDWCDPMNMVGYKGKGVSAWLTMATLYALNCWIEIVETYTPNASYGQTSKDKQLLEYKKTAEILTDKINQYFWTDNWYGRGITDDGKLFGVPTDKEGQMFVNPQSWAMLAGAASQEQQQKIVCAVNEKLATPYGVVMLAPSYTSMREDIGRVTQKSAGVAENGAVYNHAAIFYGYALYKSGFSQQGFDVLFRMLPSAENAEKIGQLPLYIPNYYRGAYYQFPEYAGRSSQLFNTGTVAWYYKTVLDGLCGLTGCANGLSVEPKLPSHWPSFSVERKFRGAVLHVTVKRHKGISHKQLFVDGEANETNVISNIVPGKCYQVEVLIPELPQDIPKLTIVMGVSGCGKSSLAKGFAQETNRVFMDADDFHSKSAKMKMAHGESLTDKDREPWLNRMMQHLMMLFSNSQSVVLAYSGLKESHRNKFRTLGFEVSFVKLNVSKQTLDHRLSNRVSHFFDPSLLTSQLQAMEVFSDKERSSGNIIELNGELPMLSMIEMLKEEL